MQVRQLIDDRGQGFFFLPISRLSSDIHHQPRCINRQQHQWNTHFCRIASFFIEHNYSHLDFVGINHFECAFGHGAALILVGYECQDVRLLLKVGNEDSWRQLALFSASTQHWSFQAGRLEQKSIYPSVLRGQNHHPLWSLLRPTVQDGTSFFKKRLHLLSKINSRQLEIK